MADTKRFYCYPGSTSSVLHPNINTVWNKPKFFASLCTKKHTKQVDAKLGKICVKLYCSTFSPTSTTVGGGYNAVVEHISLSLNYYVMGGHQAAGRCEEQKNQGFEKSNNLLSDEILRFTESERGRYSARESEKVIRENWNGEICRKEYPCRGKNGQKTEKMHTAKGWMKGINKKKRRRIENTKQGNQPSNLKQEWEGKRYRLRQCCESGSETFSWIRIHLFRIRNRQK